MTRTVASGERRKVTPKEIERTCGGRIVLEIDCPFCHYTSRATAWSLAGSGKRCRCGAMLYRPYAIANEHAIPVVKVAVGLYRTLDHAYYLGWRAYGSGTVDKPTRQGWVILERPDDYGVFEIDGAALYPTLSDARRALAAWWRKMAP